MTSQSLHLTAAQAADIATSAVAAHTANMLPSTASDGDGDGDGDGVQEVDFTASASQPLQPLSSATPTKPKRASPQPARARELAAVGASARGDGGSDALALRESTSVDMRASAVVRAADAYENEVDATPAPLSTTSPVKRVQKPAAAVAGGTRAAASKAAAMAAPAQPALTESVVELLDDLDDVEVRAVCCLRSSLS